MGSPFRLAAIAATVIAATTMAGGTANAATPTMTPLSGSTVTLITGDQVTVHGHDVAILPATRGEDFQSFQNGSGDHYVIPSVARPYLGRQLDPALFDVSALLRDGTAARTPVRLTFAATPQAPPGVTITSTQGTTAAGYVSGTAFNAALRKQIGADIAAGHPAGTAPLFDGLTGMSLAAAGAPVVAHPNFPLSILQVNGIDANGQPMAAEPVVVANTDSFAKASDVLSINDGIARVAVPAGDYMAIGLFEDFDTNGNTIASHFVNLSDFTVAASGVTTVTMDERTATSRVTVTTPRPATQDVVVNKLIRVDTTGSTFSADNIVGAGPDFVTPQPPAKVGTLHYVVQWGGQPTTEPKAAYRYDVAFPVNDGSIPADESFTVRPSQLATAHQHFSADPAVGGNPGQLLNGATDAALDVGGFTDQVASSDFVPMPGDLTEYLGTADGGVWLQEAALPSTMAFVADRRTVAAGHVYSIDWMHGPFGSGFGQHTGLQFCAVCIASGTLDLTFQPADDSEPDHDGFSFLEQNHFTLSANGTTLADQDGIFGVELTGIPAAPTTFHTVFDSDLTGVPLFSQSTHAHTDMTIQYSPGADPTLPAEDFCGGKTPTTPCAVLPALNLNYQLATDESNTSHSPVQVMGLRVGHASYDGIGSRSPITSVTVSVSPDGGTTWLPANVFGTNGFYVATWRNQAAMPALKVTAADANGDTVTQTITNAYTFAGQR